MSGRLRRTGIEALGGLPWGTHVCQFYENKEELLDVLVPYFRAGLQGNELCVWAVAGLITEEEAHAALRAAMPDYEAYAERGQLRIVPHPQRCLESGRFRPERVFENLVRSTGEALARGFDGLRASGDTFCLDSRDWEALAAYERQAHLFITRNPVLALCTFPLDRCGPEEIIDLLGSHSVALIRRQGDWRVVESAERKRMESALEQSERRFRLWMEATRSICWTLGPDTSAIEPQPTFQGYTGQTWEACKGWGWLDAVHPEDRSRARLVCEQAIEQSAACECELRLWSAAAGQYRWILARTVPELSADGSVRGWVGAGVDIHESREAETGRRETESRHRLLFDSLSDGFAYRKILFDEDGKPVDYVFLEVNEAFEKLLGVSRADAIGRRATEVLPGIENDPEDWIGTYGRIALSGEAARFEKYSENLQKWFMVSAYSPEKGTCASIFEDITERKQAEADVRFLADIGDCVQKIEGPTALLKNLTARIGDHLKVARCLFAEVDLEQERAVVHADYHRGAPSCAGIQSSLFSPEMVNEVRAGRTVVNCDSRNDPRTASYYERVYRPYGLGAYVTVPLLRDGRLSSLLMVSVPEPRAWVQREVSLLERVGERAWFGFEQARLLAAVRESEQRLRVIAENVPGLIAYVDPDYRLRFTNAAHGEWLGVQVLPEPGRSLQEMNGTDLQLRVRSHFDTVLTTGRPLSFEQTVLRADGSSLTLFFQLMPQLEHNRVAGVYALATDITERKRAEAALNKTKERFELLSETAGRLLATQTPQEIVNSLCRKVVTHLDCDVFLHYLLDEPSKRLRLCAYAGLPQPAAEEMAWTDCGVGVCGSVARDGRRIVAEGILVSPPRPLTQRLASLDIQAYACHPLFSSGRVIGTLAFGVRSRPRFTEDELSMMQRVAEQVAVAMDRSRLVEALRRSRDELEERVRERTADLAAAHERLQLEHEFSRLLSSQLIRVQENERKRVAQEIHDSIGQSLSAIKYRVEDVLQQKKKAGMSERLKGIVPLCQQAVEEARRIQADLRPPVLDDLGIVAALNGFFRQFQSTYPGIRIESRMEPQADNVPETIKIVVYRISQEALNNVAKHGAADRIVFSLTRRGHEVELSIRDNGRGFDVEAVEKDEGVGRRVGLAGMRERATLSGGHLAIDSALGAGTTIRATWSVPP
ncbi:MAG: MEDS domain-containing protein [bacterium]